MSNFNRPGNYAGPFLVYLNLIVIFEVRGISVKVRSHKPDKGGSTPSPATTLYRRRRSKDSFEKLIARFG